MGVAPKFKKQSYKTRKRRREAAETHRPSAVGTGIGIGAGVGAAVGVALGNIAVGVAVGVAIGAAVGLSRRTRPDSPDDLK